MEYPVEIIKNIINNLSFEFPYTIEDYIKNPIFENYHYHSSFSNTLVADSPTSNEEYAKRIIELNAKCIFTGEHGTIGNFLECYELSEKYNLKYRHSCEAYWVKDRHEKDSTNSHICLIATNEEGRKDLNYITSIANEDGYYYRPRIDLELLLSVNPKNLIVTSACIAGFKYPDSEEIWLKVWKHFGDNFFLEVQLHNTESQKELNKKILKMAHTYGIQLICGLDSHYINYDTDNIKRDKILEYKKIYYEDEDGWYLDFIDLNTIVKRFKEQGILNDSEIWESIINTNVFNSSRCEEIIYDKNKFKIPCVYPNTTYEERVEILKDIIYTKYKKEKNKSKEREEGIEYELSQVIEGGVADYFLTGKMGIENSINKYGGVLTTTSRGSAASYYINKLLGFTTVDRFNSEVPIYPERFLTLYRIKAGQLPDVDFNIDSQEPFVKGFKDILGEHSFYPLMAIEKLKEKAAWQLYAGVNGVEPSTANEISKFIDKYNDKLKYTDEEDREFVNIEDFIPQEYIELYKQSIEYQGIVINLKTHACGFLMLEGDIRREIGITSAISETTGKRTLCACVEGGYLDAFRYVKFDLLIVDSVGLIKECWDSINEPVPTFDELRELIKDDSLTWGIYEKGITCCINQVEKESTTEKVKKYKPKNLGELSAFIAGIRPGFKSLLGNFLDRIPYSTGEPKIDEILEDSYHYLIYQESIMHVLSFLELSMGETYDVIKSISKKKLKGKKKSDLLKELKESWKAIFGNMDNFNKVWTVIEDAARYSFNSPHSLSMGGDSAYLAYFKSHHTAKFYEVSINHYQKKDKKEKIDALMQEAIKFYNYKIGQLLFGKDNRKVIVDELEHKIYPTMVGIKNTQKVAPEILYELGKNEYDDILFIFKDLLNSGLNKTSIDILIKLDYFREYGDIHYLLSLLEVYKETAQIINRFDTCKQLNKTECEKYGFSLEDIKKYSNHETEKTFKELDNEGLSKYVKSQYKEIMKRISKKYTYYEADNLDRISYQLQLLGYSDLKDDSIDDEYYLLSGIEFNQWGTPFFNLYHPHDGESISVKVDRTWFNNYKLSEKDIGCIMKCHFKTKPKKKPLLDENNQSVLDKNGRKKWIDSDEMETILTVYKVEN